MAFPIAGPFTRLKSKARHHGPHGRFIGTKWRSRLMVSFLPWFLTECSKSIGFQTLTPDKSYMGVPGSTYAGLCRLNEASLSLDSQSSRETRVGDETQFGIIRKAALYEVMRPRQFGSSERYGSANVRNIMDFSGLNPRHATDIIRMERSSTIRWFVGSFVL